MGSKVIFALAGTEYEITAPEYGYSTRIINPFHFQRKLPIGYAVFDDGTDRDVRVFSGTFILSEAETETLLGFYTDNDKGRGVPVGMRLRKNSGFTPFAPDKGDYGNYGVVLHDVAISGALMTPYKHFAVNCSMTAQSYPSVATPTVRNDGSFSIGSVTGLRFPDRFPQAEASFGLNTQFTRNGTGVFLNTLQSSDHYETTLRMICCRSRAHALIEYLTGTIRTGSVSLDVEAGTYLFGASNGSNGTYTCQWIDSEVTVMHSNFSRYEFDLNFSLVSVA